MQIFELHFNPKTKKDRFFDSFIYEPSHSNEKRLGSLYIIGELKNGLPQNSKFLDQLAKVIKDNYYKLSYKSAEKALSSDLKKANEFLADEVKKENVSWLGNLNFSILSLKDFDLTFAKTGDLKILLIRNNQITDLGKNLDHQDIEPYPLKVFFSVVSGKLIEKDAILVLTKDIFDFFSEQGIINRFLKTAEINKKTLKEIIPAQLFNKKGGAKVSGICFITNIKKESQAKELIAFQKNEKFSFNQVFSPFRPVIKKIDNLISPIKNSINNLKKPVEYIKKSPAKLLKSPLGLLPSKKPEQKKSKDKENASWIKKLPSSVLIKKPLLPKLNGNKQGIKNRLILIAVLIAILFIGFLMFKYQEQKKEKEIEIPLNQIEEKINQAESFLILKNEKEAQVLLKKAWLEIIPLFEKEKISSKTKSKINSLKELIEIKLNDLNKLEKVENPKILFEADPSKTNFKVQKILLLNSKLYLYSPNSPIVYSFNIKENKENSFKINRNPDFGSESSNAIIFFTKPNIITYITEAYWKERYASSPKNGFNFDLFSLYLSNLYFMDSEKCEIVKYSYLNNLIWAAPKTWSKRDQCPESKSMAIDSSIWVLNSDNFIDRYHRGKYEETINLDIFPIPENITKMKTKSFLPYLYLLEPANKRLIIWNKDKKEIFKQIQSPEFNNLKDFTISLDGKTIYILNENKIYEIEI